jgi:hypothetical protein
VYFRIFSAGQVVQDGPAAPWGQVFSQALPSGARDVDLDLFCSTDASTNCYTQDPAHALTISSFMLTLSESTPPTATATGGTLLSSNPASGTESLQYTATDADSGPLSVAVKLGSTTITTTSFAGSCSPGDFSPCPQAESPSVSVDTTRVADGTYPLVFAVGDYAGNNATVNTGQNVTVDNTPPPIDVVQPSIVGSLNEGQTLTGDPGTWSGPPLTFAYRWQRCTSIAPSSCNPIPGAIGLTYTTGAADAGDYIRLAVTATNSQGRATAYSDLVGPIVPAPAPPAPAPPGPPAPAPTPSGGGGASSPSAPSSPSPERDHNGAGRGEQATLTAQFANNTQTVIAPYGRQVTMNGALTAPDGSPVAGAALEVLQQSAAPFSPPVLIERTATDAAGQWTFTFPARIPNSSITVGWKAYTLDSAYAQTATDNLVVVPKITLAARPRRPAAGRRVVFSGLVLGGPYPPGGPLVAIQAGYKVKPRRPGGAHIAWRTLVAGRARNGAYKIPYRFKRGGHWRLEAAVVQQSRYPYAPGASAPTRVVVAR